MLPTIVTGGSVADRESYVRQLLTSRIDLHHVTLDTTSITIKQVHALANSLQISARLPRLVWIEEANLLTIPAQNALLKLLEEPPQNTRFYLTCASAASLLPTIRSRCFITSLQLSAQFEPHIFSELKNLMSLPLGLRLSQLPKQDRPTAQAYFRDLQSSLRLKLRSSTLTAPQRSTLTTIAKLAQTASLQLKNNVGVSLVYESFYLHLPKTK